MNRLKNWGKSTTTSDSMFFQLNYCLQLRRSQVLGGLEWHIGRDFKSSTSSIREILSTSIQVSCGWLSHNACFFSG